MFEDPVVGRWDVGHAEAVRISALLRRSHWAIYNRGIIGEHASHVDDELDFARALFFAPHAVLAHDIVDTGLPADVSSATTCTRKRDNVFIYANVAAARLFECCVADLIGRVSTVSAETSEQRDRAALLADCVLRGAVDYSGVRVAVTGSRFRISSAILFNLVDHDRGGVYRGQATVIDIDKVSQID